MVRQLQAGEGSDRYLRSIQKPNGGPICSIRDEGMRSHLITFTQIKVKYLQRYSGRCNDAVCKDLKSSLIYFLGMCLDLSLAVVINGHSF